MRAAAFILPLLAASTAHAQVGDAPRKLVPIARDLISAVYDIDAAPPYAYALERNRIRVLDVRDPAAVREVTAVELDAPRVRSIVHGSRLYVYGFEQPLGMVDISDPASARWLGNHPEVNRTFSALADAGRDLLFVLRRSDAGLSLDVLRLTPDGATPVPLASLEIGPPPSRAGAVTPFLDGRRVYVLQHPEQDSGAEIAVVDVSVPDAPALVRRIRLPRGRRYNEVAARGELLYLVTRDPDGLAVHRMRRSGEPELLGEVTDSRLWYGADLLLRGDALYVTFKGEIVLATFDVRDPSAPRLAHGFQIPAAGLGFSLAEDRLYVSGDAGPSAILDLGDPLAPRYLGRWDYQGGWAADVALIGPLAIVLNRWFGVVLVDVRDPSVPSRLAYHVGGKPQRSVGFAVDEDRVLVTYDSLPAELLDVSAPAAPKLIRRFPLPREAAAAVLTPTHALMGYADGGLGVIPLDAPEAGHELPLPLAASTLALHGPRLVAGHPDGAISLIDVGDPGNPRLLGHAIGLGARAEAGATTRLALSADGSLAFTVTGAPQTAGGAVTLRIHDVGSDGAPRLLGSLPIERSGYASELSIAVTESGHCLIGLGHDLVRIDGTDPARPRVAARYPLETTLPVEGLAVRGRHVLVGAAEDGLLVFELPPLRDAPSPRSRE